MPVISDGDYSDYEGCEGAGFAFSLQSKLRRAHCREKAEIRKYKEEQEKARLEAEAKLSPEEREALEAKRKEIIRLREENEHKYISFEQACDMYAGNLWKRLKQPHSDVLRADLMALKNKRIKELNFSIKFLVNL